MRKGLQRDALVVTAALMMTFTHLIKIVLFALLGFSFISYWQIIIGMSVAVVAGALLGTHIRYKIPEDVFRKILKWALTLLAVAHDLYHACLKPISGTLGIPLDSK